MQSLRSMSALSAYMLACGSKNPQKAPPDGYALGYGCFGHEESGVMVRSEPIHITPISDRDIVLYHYTDHAGFSAISGSKTKHIRASYAERAHFGDGIYASQHPPDFFGSKERILLNNYTNASDRAMQQRQIKVWREKGVADYCLALVVSRDLVVNVSAETTKEMTMPGHTLAHGPLREGRDIWVVVISDGSNLVHGYEDADSVHYRWWKSSDFSMRLDAVEIFAGHAAMGDARATTNVLNSLHDDDFNVRVAAVWATVGSKALTASEKCFAITQLAQNEPVEAVLNAIKEGLSLIGKIANPKLEPGQASVDVVTGTKSLIGPGFRSDQDSCHFALNMATSTTDGHRAEMEELRFDQKYILEEKAVGEGTYGAVYKGKCTKTGRTVAVKKMKSAHEEEGVPSTAIREVAVLKGAEHPNIVKLLDVYCTLGSIHLVFEFVDMNLKEHMRMHSNSLSSSTVCHFALQLTRGIHFLHTHRIIHRDLKPQNLLVSSDKSLKVADFGMARAFSLPIPKYTHEVVTTWYRAPEILFGSQEYALPVDIWSIGCILGEMAAGTALFRGDSEIDTIFQIFQKLGTPSDVEWPGLSKLPDFKPTFPQWRRVPWSNIRSVATTLGARGTQLLDEFLHYDPRRRISARQALKDAYFTSNSAVMSLSHADADVVVEC